MKKIRLGSLLIQADFFIVCFIFLGILNQNYKV